MVLVDGKRNYRAGQSDKALNRCCVVGTSTTHGLRYGTECAKKPGDLKVQPRPGLVRLLNELLSPSRRSCNCFLRGLPSCTLPRMQPAVDTRRDSCLFG